jgi:LytS/YehU family sensor histidine kinase
MFNQKLLAPLITIDLIENAFKHADLQKSNSFIHVTFQFNDGVFTLTVANSISPRPPLEKISGGIGIATLEQRLDFFYKDCYQLDRFYENNVFISHLEINLFDFKSKLLLKHKKNG